jgi:hypothetical protein
LITPAPIENVERHLDVNHVMARQRGAGFLRRLYRDPKPLHRSVLNVLDQAAPDRAVVSSHVNCAVKQKAIETVAPQRLARFGDARIDRGDHLGAAGVRR